MTTTAQCMNISLFLAFACIFIRSSGLGMKSTYIRRVWDPSTDYAVPLHRGISPEINPMETSQFIQSGEQVALKNEDSSEDDPPSSESPSEEEEEVNMIPAAKTLPIKKETNGECLVDSSGKPLPGEVEAGRCHFDSQSSTVKAKLSSSESLLNDISEDSPDVTPQLSPEEIKKQEVSLKKQVRWASKMRKLLNFYLIKVQRVESHIQHTENKLSALKQQIKSHSSSKSHHSFSGKSSHVNSLKKEAALLQSKAYALQSEKEQLLASINKMDTKPFK